MNRWHSILSTACLAALAGGLLAFAPASSPALAALDSHDESSFYANLVKNKGDAIVSIKYILKEEDSETEEEVLGAVIEESGLVITSNYFMGGFPESLKQMMGGNRKPQEIKVMIAGDQEGLDATLIARDSELDLAWLQISNKDNKKFVFIDTAKPVETKMGERLFTIERLSKTNDHAHIINQSVVRTIISKPRKLVVPGNELGSSLGMPVFNGKGEFVGMSSLQLPSREEMEADQSSQFAQMRRIRGAMILPGEDVVKATAAAKEQAKSGKPVDEESAATSPAAPSSPFGTKPDAPTEEPKPADPKPDQPK
jgi:hypothetical protein